MMAQRDFAAFVEEQNRSDTAAIAKRGSRLAEWLRYLAQLYATVETILSPFVETGGVRLEYRAATLNEEWLGSYDTTKLFVHIGSNVAELRPIGAMIFGAEGRVDLVGPRDTRTIVLVPATSRRTSVRIMSQDEMDSVNASTDGGRSLAWKFSRGPHQDFAELDADNLTTAIMEVTSG